MTKIIAVIAMLVTTFALAESPYPTPPRPATAESASIATAPADRLRRKDQSSGAGQDQRRNLLHGTFLICRRHPAGVSRSPARSEAFPDSSVAQG